MLSGLADGWALPSAPNALLAGVPYSVLMEFLLLFILAIGPL